MILEKIILRVLGWSNHPKSDPSGPLPRYYYKHDSIIRELYMNLSETIETYLWLCTNSDEEKHDPQRYFAIAIQYRINFSTSITGKYRGYIFENWRSRLSYHTDAAGLETALKNLPID